MSKRTDGDYLRDMQEAEKEIISIEPPALNEQLGGILRQEPDGEHS